MPAHVIPFLSGIAFILAAVIDAASLRWGSIPVQPISALAPSVLILSALLSIPLSAAMASLTMISTRLGGGFLYSLFDQPRLKELVATGAVVIVGSLIGIVIPTDIWHGGVTTTVVLFWMTILFVIFSLRYSLWAIQMFSNGAIANYLKNRGELVLLVAATYKHQPPFPKAGLPLSSEELSAIIEHDAGKALDVYEMLLGDLCRLAESSFSNGGLFSESYPITGCICSLVVHYFQIRERLPLCCQRKTDNHLFLMITLLDHAIESRSGEALDVISINGSWNRLLKLVVENPAVATDYQNGVAELKKRFRTIPSLGLAGSTAKSATPSRKVAPKTRSQRQP